MLLPLWECHQNCFFYYVHIGQESYHRCRSICLKGECVCWQAEKSEYIAVWVVSFGRAGPTVSRDSKIRFQWGHQGHSRSKPLTLSRRVGLPSEFPVKRYHLHGQTHMPRLGCVYQRDKLHQWSHCQVISRPFKFSLWDGWIQYMVITLIGIV